MTCDRLDREGDARMTARRSRADSPPGRQIDLICASYVTGAAGSVVVQNAYKQLGGYRATARPVIIT